MKLTRILTFCILFLSFTVVITGCWNYREIEELSVVAGAAIDQGSNSGYQLTVEIVEVSGGGDTQTKSKAITTEGKTIFEAARNEISIAGKKLYWSHAKVLIISQEFGAEGILEIIDWFNRDAETREDIIILLSKDPAKEILKAPSLTEQVKSFELENIIKNENNLSKARKVDLWELTNEIAVRGISPTLPLISMTQVGDLTVPRVSGTAIFDGDTLLGFIDGEKTKDLLFIKNEIEGGLLIEGTDGSPGEVPISLEIFESNTKIKPSGSVNNLEMNIDVETIVAVNEIGGVKNVIEDSERKQLEQLAGKKLKKRLEVLIRTVQTEFGKDIFGFGLIISRERPKLWKQISLNWKEEFKDLKVNVNTTVHIRNSGMLTEPLEVAE